MARNITQEAAFEEAIELSLIESGGYHKSNPQDFDPEIGFNKKELFAFLQKSQPVQWEKLNKIHGSQFEQKFIYRIGNEIENRGLLDVMRKGVTDYGVRFQFAYVKPSSTLNSETIELYNKNYLSIARQVHFSKKTPNKSLDCVLLINGFPLVTIELKNPITNQTCENAIRQYKEDRDSKELIFQFNKRSLVHFAVDPDQAFMTTKLEGDKTVFLPFNKGRNFGKGNPDNPNGYKTSYLWEEVLVKDSLLDIVGKFLHLQKEEKTVPNGKKIKKEKIIFPRFHQLDVVRKLEEKVKKDGAGQNYLIQHSAGSGKSNSIAWLAHRLASLHNDQNNSIFRSVIVITDRRVLDSQLQDTIYQFEHKLGVVQKVDEHSEQLAEALNGGTRIIITTLQKFPFVLDKVKELSQSSYAIIVDEAHSSQTGESSKKLKEVLSSKTLEEAEKTDSAIEKEEIDSEEFVLRSMQARGKQSNLSYFAFTATPKGKTLEIFGQKSSVTGKPEPFHLYSMRQAIEEGFILDVLKNYITYKLYFKIEKQIQDDPEVDKKKASKAIARFVSLHPHNLAQKTEIIIEHFRKFTRHKIGGLAKAMVVTSSRLHAVRYKHSFDKYLKEKGYNDIKALVAFSGTVQDPENTLEYTEANMNGFGSKQIPEKFETTEYQLLLVADKYQTGFDQPLLHTMYVDKRLSDVKAVQTLSRLNRTHPGKIDTFVLDFVNERGDILHSFQPFYEQTQLKEEADPNKLYDLKAKLDSFQVYEQKELENFAKTFFNPNSKQTPAEQRKLYAITDIALTRLEGKTEEEKEDFKSILQTYIRLYSFLSQIIDFQDIQLEMLYAYGRVLLTRIPRLTNRSLRLDDELSLHYYRLSKIEDGSISLIPGLESFVKSPSDVTGKKNEKIDSLSQIIEMLNERFGTDFTKADELFFQQIEEDLIADDKLAQQAQNNTIDNFKFGFEDVFTDKLIGRMDQNQEIFNKIMDDEKFSRQVKEIILNSVYERFKEGNK